MNDVMKLARRITNHLLDQPDLLIEKEWLKTTDFFGSTVVDIVINGRRYIVTVEKGR